MIQTIYNIVLKIGWSLIPILPSLKIQTWVNEQKNIWNSINELTFDSPLWIHVASAGEFEQVKPVIGKLQSKNINILLTFFSPSGYKNFKNRELVDSVTYLPLDTKENVIRFLNQVQPRACVFVKYEFWLNYMTELNNRQIPIFLLSGVFSNDHFLFKWYGKAHLKQVKKFHYISVQDSYSANILKKHGIRSEVTGDTRIDRAIELPETTFNNQMIKKFTEENLTIIIGSAWEEDIRLFERAIQYFNKQSIRLIIAPHELDKEHLHHIQSTFDGVFLSKLDSSETVHSNTLIIDSIGILKYIYRYADIAFIGGGFGKGIHNTLEPASYGIPVLFGPNYDGFIEANQLIKQRGAFSINNSKELLKIVKALENDAYRNKIGANAYHYLDKNKGASSTVANRIIEQLNLSNKSGE